MTPSSVLPAASAGGRGREAVAAFADTAAFVVLVISTLAVPLTFSVAQPDVFALPKTLVAVALAAVVATFLTVRWLAIGRPTHLPRSALAAALVFYLVWNVIATALAIDRNQALIGERLQFQGLIATLTYAVFFLTALTTVRTPQRRRLLMLTIAAGAVVVSTYAILQRLGLDPIWPYLPYGRVFSTIGQANALAAYLVLTTSLTFGIPAGGRWPARMLSVAATALMLTALALTFSRGGYLGLFTSATVFAVVLWSRRRGLNLSVDRRVAGIAGLAVMAVVLIALLVPGVRAMTQQVVARALMTADLGETSILGHLDMWAVGVTIAGDHPVVGTGPDTYVLLFGEYREKVLSPDRLAIMRVFRPESPHNVPIAIAQGAGLPALISYLWLVVAVTARILRAMRSTVDRRTLLTGAAVLAAIAGHLVTDAFMTAETAGSLLFWTTLGIGAALVAGFGSETVGSATESTARPASDAASKT